MNDALRSRVQVPSSGLSVSVQPSITTHSAPWPITYEVEYDSDLKAMPSEAYGRVPGTWIRGHPVRVRIGHLARQCSVAVNFTRPLGWGNQDLDCGLGMVSQIGKKSRRAPTCPPTVVSTLVTAPSRRSNSWIVETPTDPWGRPHMLRVMCWPEVTAHPQIFDFPCGRKWPAGALAEHLRVWLWSRSSFLLLSIDALAVHRRKWQVDVVVDKLTWGLGVWSVYGTA